MNIPTAHSTESLTRFLRHIQSAPIPSQISRSYLKQHGFTSGNDPELRHICRLLGFLNDSDEPLELWHQYKIKGQPALKEAVLKTYDGVFEIFQDAPQRSEEELALWFRPPTTGETRSAIERAIRTFRKLCQEAGLTSGTVSKTSTNAVRSVSEPILKGAATGPGPIVIQPPNFKEEADYVRFFTALKKVFYE